MVAVGARPDFGVISNPSLLDFGKPDSGRFVARRASRSEVLRGGKTLTLHMLGAVLRGPREKARLEPRLNPNLKPFMLHLVPITMEQIIEETRHWPPEKAEELVGRLNEDLHASDPETETAWKAEIVRRVGEIQTGKVQGVPVEDVFKSAKRILGG